MWSRFKERFKMNEEYIQWKKARFWCKPKHSCKSQLFWKRWLWRPKGHQLPKSICFLNCVFLPCYFQYTYPTCPWAVQGSLEAAHTLPNGFPFVETRLTKEKKLVKPLQGRVSCYPVGCVTSLVTIITNGRSRRDLPLATSWHRVLPPTSPKICVSKREETMRQFGDNAHAQRDTSDTLVTETALALLRKQLTELGTTVINVLLSSIFFLSIFGYRFFFLWLNISLNELIQ